MLIVETYIHKNKFQRTYLLCLLLGNLMTPGGQEEPSPKRIDNLCSCFIPKAHCDVPTTKTEAVKLEETKVTLAATLLVPSSLPSSHVIAASNCCEPPARQSTNQNQNHFGWRRHEPRWELATSVCVAFRFN